MPLPDLNIYLEDVASEAILNQEILDRIAADLTLQNEISAEATARINADASLQSQVNANATNLTSEITNRINADSVLQTNINNAIAGLLDGVATPGNTLQKLYNLILGSFQEITVADIAARNAYNAVNGMHVFVTDDGDGKWALYKATTAGINATYVKLSDPDLLNAIMSASQIKAAYESNPDTNAFTNALLAKVNGIQAGATANSTDAQLRDRSTHTGTQSVSTITGLSTDTVAEGSTNKYSTNSRVLAYVLTGLAAAASRVLPSASDTLIAAWGKVLKYLTDLGTAAFKNVGMTSNDVAAGNQAQPGKSIITSTSTISNTGSTTENLVLASQNLVGFVEANDQFYISLMANATNNANQKTIRFYVSDSPSSLVNQQLLGLTIITTGGATTTLVQKGIWMRGSLNAANNMMIQVANSASFASGNTSTITVDLTSGTKYIVMTMQNAVGTDAFNVFSLWGTQFRP